MALLADLLIDRATLFVPLLLSLTVHEWAHAWTAWRLGDDTAKMLGRVSLNPVDHIDPVGTLLLPLLGMPFGWAKPVPINPVRFRAGIRMSTGVMLTAAAGPISNVLLAAVSLALLAGLHTLTAAEVLSLSGLRMFEAVVQLLEYLVLINVLLALFNLLPIPPLDGSRIVDAFVPAALRPVWSQIAALGPLLLAAVILLPLLLGINVLAQPMRWVATLLQSVSGV